MKNVPTGSVLKTRAYFAGKVVVALFAAIVYYSYLLAPDWMFNYFTKASEVPGWMILYIFALYFVAYTAGFILKFELQKMGQKLGRFYPIMIGVLLLAVSILVPLGLGSRYTVVGSLEQFLAGTAVPLPESAVGKLPGILTGLLVPLAVGLLFWSRKQEV